MCVHIIFPKGLEEVRTANCNQDNYGCYYRCFGEEYLALQNND